MNFQFSRAHTLYSILFFFIVTQNYGQTVIENDSLSKYSFKELSGKFYAAKPDSLKALIYANYHLKKALIEKDTLKIASSYYLINSFIRDTNSFIFYWNKIISNNSTNNYLKAFGSIKVGDFYFHKGNKDNALKKYLKALEYSLKINNDSLKMISRFRIGLMKSNKKDYFDAIKHYKISLKYFKKKSKNRNLDEFYSILLSLSSSFKSLQIFDSAHYYNDKLYSIASLKGDSVIMGYTANNKGNILYQENKFKESINYLKSSLHYIHLDENYIILSRSFLKLAHSHVKLKESTKAIKYFIRIDSLFSATKNYYKSQKPAYKYLINYYKKEGNDKKQLEFINKYIKVDSVLNTRSKSINKTFTKNYDIPNLLEERKVIEERLKSKLSFSNKWIIALSFFTAVLTIFLGFQYKRKKRYKKSFLSLIEKETLQEKTPNKKSIPKKHTIPEEVFNKILLQLIEFEKNHDFIKPNVTLSILAKKFETNAKYLSQAINQEKQKSFNNYVNELRIHYTVEKLKSDTTFRKFSIKAIANEVGFNTTESFSKAFVKFTGIKPSYFIKELKTL